MKQFVLCKANKFGFKIPLSCTYLMFIIIGPLMLLFFRGILVIFGLLCSLLTLKSTVMSHCLAWNCLEPMD